MIDVAKVINLAQDAGAMIMEIYNDPARQRCSMDKSDGSPLTLADKAAHDCIVAGLTAIDSSIPILSEEQDSRVSYENRQYWLKYWLVDPLDGTKEYLKRNGEFTVNIALIENNEPVMGVVFSPVLECTYYATKGNGAFKLEGNVSTLLPATQTNNTDMIRAVVSESHMSSETAAYLKQLEKSTGKKIETISAGSSLKLCCVAEGKAEVYPRLGPTMEWDTAAADCVVRESGGCVLDASDDSQLLYNKSDLRNPSFIAFRSFFNQYSLINGKAAHFPS